MIKKRTVGVRTSVGAHTHTGGSKSYRVAAKAALGKTKTSAESRQEKRKKEALIFSNALKEKFPGIFDPHVYTATATAANETEDDELWTNESMANGTAGSAGAHVNVAEGAEADTMEPSSLQVDRV